MTMVPVHNKDEADAAESAAREATASWLDVPTSARILGCSRRNIQKMCASGDLVAAQVEGLWRVDPACRPQFRIAAGDVSAPVLAGSGLSGLSAAKRSMLAARARIVESYLDAESNKPSDMTQAQFVQAWIDVHNHTNPNASIQSSRTLYRWVASYKEEGIAGLADRRRYSGHGAEVCDMRAWSMFAGLYLNQSQPYIPRLYTQVAAHAAVEGWAWPTLRTIQRYCVERLDPKLAALGRDPKRFRDRCVPYIERDGSQIPAMCLWVADHRRFDVFIPRAVWNEKKHVHEFGWYRPWLTMFLDFRTWMPVAWRISFEDPNGDRVMATFADGVNQHGKPDHVYLDNGKDFRMKRFSGGRRGKGKLFAEGEVKDLLTTLGVGVTFATPYNAKAKVIEPFFRLVSNWFDKTWATYCGRDAIRKPEQLAALRNEAGRFHKEGLSIESFTAAFTAWVTDDYALRSSPSQWANGLSAARAFAELRSPDFVPTRPSEAEMALLLMRSVPVKLDQNGVWVRPFLAHYWSDDLEWRRCGSDRDMKRKICYRYDPDDASKVFVFDATTDRFLCVATPYIGGGIHPLATPMGNDQDKDRLEAAIEMQRHTARHTGVELRALKRFASNVLLADQAAGAKKLGLLDTSGTIPTPPAPVIRMNPDLAKAADQGRKADDQAESKRKSTARQFYESFQASTGTDDAVAQGGGVMSALADALTPDGPTTAGTESPEEPRHGGHQ